MICISLFTHVHFFFFFFSSRRRHTRYIGDWSSDVCSSDLLIRSSQSDGEPRVYAVEDIAEASVVAELFARGVRHRDGHRAPERLARRYGPWPLSDAPLGTIVEDGGRPRIVLHERDGIYELVPRGWQLMAAPPPVDDVRVRLHHAP